MFMFEKSGYVFYDGERLTNIFAKYLLKGYTKSNQKYLIDYTVKDGETAESIMTKLFEMPDLDWLLMMVNEMVDPYHDWPLSYEELNNYMIDKYTLAGLDDTHHYEDSDGYIINDEPGAIAVSNRDFEYAENDKKRRIKIPTNEFISVFMDLFEGLE